MPTQPPYYDEWGYGEVFITREYIYPLEDSEKRDSNEHSSINDLLVADIRDIRKRFDSCLLSSLARAVKRFKSPYTVQLRRSIRHVSASDAKETAEHVHNAFPKLCWEFCFWYDRVVTTEETDDLMLETMGLVIHAYHYDIVEGDELFDISWLLPFARAIRERVYGGEGQPWDDEYP